MNIRLSEYPAVVFASQEPPCLSIYQKTHRCHPENQQDPIRFRNLVKRLEESLAKTYTKREIEPLLKPFYDLADDHRFWNHTLDGLAVLGASDMFKTYRLQEDVRDIAVVSDTFYTKPLVRIFKSSERYQLLAVSRKGVRLFEGTKVSLDEVELHESIPKTLTEALGDEVTAPHQTVASYGGTRGPAMHHGHGGKKPEEKIDAERFFRVIDKGVLEHHSNHDHLPLVLAALPENQGIFRQISQNPWLVEKGLDLNPDALQSIDLQAKARDVFEEYNRMRLQALIELYGDAFSRSLGSGDLEEVAAAAASGRISMLFIDNDYHVPACLDRSTGKFEPDDPGNPVSGDLLDDIGELVLQKGGEVHVVQSESMPTRTGVAAVFRF